MRRNFITVVSGLPRSGTSLMMQMLAAGGIPPLTDDLRTADENNPRGYLEFDRVKRLRQDASWIDQAIGCAVKVVHLLLRELPTDPRLHYRVLFMQRHLDEVLASQRAMLEREGKKPADNGVLARVYKSQLEQAEEWLAQQSNFSVLRIDHRHLFDDGAAICQQVNQFLGRDLDVAAMSKAIDPALYRQRIV
ncbi:MAG: sulfotransferase [Verrucomicrobiota bacterium]|nr:sulfotransferase [Verrucomicrobiota bacterium]